MENNFKINLIIQGIPPKYLKVYYENSKFEVYQSEDLRSFIKIDLDFNSLYENIYVCIGKNDIEHYNLFELNSTQVEYFKNY